MIFWKQAWVGRLLVAVLAAGLLSSCGIRRKKYENPITKDTQQPDKVLYDKAVHDIERGRFEVARITLNTLINTYDASEFLAKAKLAIADSWYREGGSHGLAQAEAEYKDFILFYPTMEESAESQYKICQIHYKQMDKADRDTTEALKAEAECRQLLVQFQNSKFAPGAEQTLRNIQEALADSEMHVGQFYHHKGSFPAAANRLNGVVEQYPLYSKADEALWMDADCYSKMGPRFRNKAGEAYQRLVRDYPLSEFVASAKNRLKEMEMPIPEADPVALNRMKYELENATGAGFFRPLTDVLKRGPDVHMAAKSGTPTMTSMRPIIPASVPAPAAERGFQGDVTVQQVTDTTALDTKPDARQNPPVEATAGAASAPAEQTAAPSGAQAGATPASGTQSATTQPANPNQDIPTNHPLSKSDRKRLKKLNKMRNQTTQPQPAADPTSASPSQPAAQNPVTPNPQQ